MASPIRILVALDTGADRDTVEAVIPVVPGVELSSIVDDLHAGWRELSGGEFDAVLVACGSSPNQALAFTEGVAADFPDRAVLLLHSGTSNGFSRRALAAGAEDLVALPVVDGEPPSPADRERVSGELLAALEKGVARRRRAVAGPRVAQGRMVAVVGPKGGAGKTLVATNLAVALAEAGERVVLIDVDLQFGDAGLVLGLAPTRTIYELVKSGGSLDAEKLNDYLTVHESGARVLQGPSRPDQAAAVDVEFLRQLFGLLRATQDWVIVDSSPGFTAEVIAAVDASTDVCMVGTVDAAALKNTKLGLETLELMGVAPELIKLVVNRSDSRVGITPDDVHAVTGRPADVLIPSHRDVARSANDGRPIILSHSGSEPARALRGLAAAYMGADNHAGIRKSLRRIFGKAS
jgi:pilus assembly protein CpaE